MGGAQTCIVGVVISCPLASLPWPDLDHDHAFLCTSEAIFQPFLRVEKRFSDRTAELSRWMALSSITTV